MTQSEIEAKAKVAAVDIIEWTCMTEGERDKVDSNFVSSTIAGLMREAYDAGKKEQREIDEIHKVEIIIAIKDNLTNKEFRKLLEQMPDDACICIECCNPRGMVYDKENNLIRID